MEDHIKSYLQINRKFECILCGITIDYTSLGSNLCVFHPLQYNWNHGNKFPRDHYECCGASRNAKDKLHYESSMIKGCWPIDHIEFIEELKNIQENPIVVIPKSEISPKNKDKIILIENEDGLGMLEVTVPQNKIVHVNLMEKYVQYIQPDHLKSKDTERSNSFYWYTYPNISDEIGNMFTPFYVIKRIGDQQTTRSLRNFNSRTSCTAFNDTLIKYFN